MPARTKAHIDLHLKFTRELIAYHYKKKKISIAPLSGGITNFVYGVHVGKEELVVRMSEEREKINFFLKEQWAVARAKEKGIPVPEILEVGNDIIPRPYMITRRINGDEATHHNNRFEIIREMGHYATLIHTIPTNGFGHMFDWSQNTLSKNKTWKDYIDCELKAEERIAVLIKNKMLPSRAISRLRNEIRQMQKWDQPACLHHGDLRLKNMMVSKEGKIIAIIDWENCVSSIAPYWDTSIALHDLSLDAQGKYLEGYGITGKHLIEIAPALKALNLLNYAPVIELLAKKKRKSTLDYYRARLHGALDMFSL